MATFLTGVTGYLGSYLAAGLLREGEELGLLIRARSPEEAERRLWRSLQLHFDFPTFRDHLRARLRLFPGDLTVPDFGLPPDELRHLADTTDSILHCAAALNRKSERACLDVNLRGTLEVVRLALRIRSASGLRRFSHVSTVSVAGKRSHETVGEDEAIDWSRRDYDAYGRTKKFAEHLCRRLLADVPLTVFRPSIVLGDSGRPETTQFDMVRAFALLARLPALPLAAGARIDIVPADWVAEAIVALHRKDAPAHDTYHLSAGRSSPTYRSVTDVISRALGTRPPIFLPVLGAPFSLAARALARVAPGDVRRAAALLEVFLPYLRYDTVFDGSRAAREIGREPPSFPDYCVGLLEFARRNRFAYPYAPWPEDGASPPAAAGDTTPAGSAVP